MTGKSIKEGIHLENGCILRPDSGRLIQSARNRPALAELPARADERGPAMAPESSKRASVWQAHRLHPLRVQLRPRGPARRRRRPARISGSGGTRQHPAGPRATPARSPRASTSTRTIPESADPAACGAGADGTFEDHRLGHRDPGGRRALRSAIRDSTAANRSSTTAAAGRAITCPAATRARPARPRLALPLERARPGEDRRAFVGRSRCSGHFTRGDFEHCEVGVFIGKNPWFSHGLPRARVTLRELAKDPKRCADRDRSAADGDGRPRRHPPAGEAGRRRLAAGRDLRGDRPGRSCSIGRRLGWPSTR